jgi:hypothetical protein
MTKIKQVAQYTKYAELVSIPIEQQASTSIQGIAQPQQHTASRLKSGRAYEDARCSTGALGAPDNHH